MEYVEPIRDLKKINLIKRLLKRRSLRDYLLFILGINIGLRISQLLDLKVIDVVEPDFTPKEFLIIPTSKHSIYLNDNVQQAVRALLGKNQLSFNDFLFTSTKKSEPITRQQAYRIIKQATVSVGIEDKIGTHTHRKTFGYHAYRQGIALALLQERFNHVTPAETLKYIGITKEDPHVPRINVNL